jgi:ornithine--oxo-acid transaminase
MDRAVVHGSTFGKNNLAMAAGLATLAVLDDENMLANAALRGENLRRRLGELAGKYELLKEVRGLGLMIALEFGAPKSLKLRAAWSLVEAATKGLFCQTVIIPLFSRHRILTQVAGHEMSVIKLLPPLCISQQDEDWVVAAFDDVLAECHKVPSAVWDLVTTLAGNTIKSQVRV